MDSSVSEAISVRGHTRLSELYGAFRRDHLSSLLLVCGAACLIGVFQLCQTWWRLRHIPGPFLAKITNYQRMSWVWTKRAHLVLQDMHDRYGEIVRIGPNTVSFSNPEAIPTVYPMRPGVVKSEFYVTLRPYTRTGGAMHAVFNTVDETLHKQIKTPIAPFYSVSNTTLTEGLVDEVLECLGNKLDRGFAKTGETFDLGAWLQFFAFDAMGTMTFSKRYGFLDQGRDVRGMLAAIKQYMRASAMYTQCAWLDRLMNKNRFADKVRQVIGRTASMTILGFVGQAIKERREKLAAGKTDSAGEENGRKDFLTRFIEIQEGSPNVPAWAPTAWTFSNVIAGSDSVGSVMRTAMFNLLTHHESMQELQRELRSAKLSWPIPRYAEVRDLPYLDACIQEASRMHPPFALPFERVVPEGGIEILGYHLPPGTVVGGNPYVVNRHKNTFGDDAELWRPGRWLEHGDAHKRKLEQANLTFGAGRRVCLGKHIGILEIKKLIPFLLIHYNISIRNPGDFEVENSWFFFQTGLHTQIQPRVAGSETFSAAAVEVS